MFWLVRQLVAKLVNKVVHRGEFMLEVSLGQSPVPISKRGLVSVILLVETESLAVNAWLKVQTVCLVIVPMARVVFLSVMTRLLMMRVAEVVLPASAVMVSSGGIPVMAGVALMVSCECILRGVVNGHLLDLIVAVLMMMRVGGTNLFRVRVVVGALSDDIVVIGKRHGEVKRLVLRVLVVVGVVLVTMSVLRGHVVVGRVLVVVRVSAVDVALVVLVGRGVVTLVMGTSGVSVSLTDMSAGVRVVALVVSCLLVMRDLVVDSSNDLVMDWDGNMRSLVVCYNGGVLVEVGQMSGLGVVDGSSNVLGCLVMRRGCNDVPGCLVMRLGSNDVLDSLMMRSSDVSRLVMGSDSLVLSMDGVLHVVDRGVSGDLDMSGMNLLSVMRLRHLLVGWLVVSGNRHVLHDRHGHVRGLVVHWDSLVVGGTGSVLVKVSQMLGLVVHRGGNVDGSLMVHRGDDLLVVYGKSGVENRRVQMVRILVSGNVVSGLSVMDGSSNMVRC